MLSQLPAEVAAEEHVKTVVLGLPPRSDGGGAPEPRGAGGTLGGAQLGGAPSAPGVFAMAGGAWAAYSGGEGANARIAQPQATNGWRLGR
jgi:hypothetical protein